MLVTAEAPTSACFHLKARGEPWKVPSREQLGQEAAGSREKLSREQLGAGRS